MSVTGSYTEDEPNSSSRVQLGIAQATEILSYYDTREDKFHTPARLCIVLYVFL